VSPRLELLSFEWWGLFCSWHLACDRSALWPVQEVDNSAHHPLTSGPADAIAKLDHRTRQCQQGLADQPLYAKYSAVNRGLTLATGFALVRRSWPAERGMGFAIRDLRSEQTRHMQNPAIGDAIPLPKRRHSPALVSCQFTKSTLSDSGSWLLSLKTIRPHKPRCDARGVPYPWIGKSFFHIPGNSARNEIHRTEWQMARRQVPATTN
jgi:hypothetical protein